MASPMTYGDAVEALARANWSADPTIRETWAFDDPDGKVVRLLHATDASLPAENGHLPAYQFGPKREFVFPSEIALVSLADLDRAKAGTLELPSGWDWSSDRRLRG